MRDLCDEFMAGVPQNLRGRLASDIGDNRRMLSSGTWSRTDRVTELLVELLYGLVQKEAGDSDGPWRMTDLFVNPPNRRGFSWAPSWRAGRPAPLVDELARHVTWPRRDPFAQAASARAAGRICE